MGNRTPLYDWHAAHGARMVDFAGWEMPVQYSSIVEEHQAVRAAVGLFDISHMGRLSFVGPDALDLIQRVWTNDAATMRDFQVRYGLVCNPGGGIRDDVLVYRWPQGWAMVVNASNRTKIIAWLAEHKATRKVEVVDETLDTCMLAVQGPRALAICRGLAGADPADLRYYEATSSTYNGKPCILSRTGYTGEDGVEIIADKAQAVELWEALVSRGALPCGLGARDTLRLEAAMPLYGHELSEELDPLQACLGWAVKMEKGEFVGRARLQQLQTQARPQRVGLVLEGKRIAREGAAVLRDGQTIGKVTSGTFAPTLQKAIAMAYVDPRHKAQGTACEVDIRGKPAQGRVVPLPFYRRK